MPKNANALSRHGSVAQQRASMLIPATNKAMTQNTINTNADHVLLGVVLMLGFCLTAPMLDVCAKLASDAIPVGQITAARFALQIVLMAPVCVAMGLSFKMNGMFAALTLRAALLALSTYFFIAAIEKMPLADALAIVFVLPFIVMLIGKYFYGEEVGPKRIMAALVGFIGVLMVIQPSFTLFGLVALYPLGTAFSFAGYVIVTRHLRGKLNTIMMHFHTGWIATLICLPPLLIGAATDLPMFDPVWPDPYNWALLVGVGLFATISHMMMTFALTFAPSSTLAPLQYLEIPVATIMGWFVFSDFPNNMALIGIAIIIGAGLYMIHREQQAARQAKHASSAAAR